MTFLTKVSAFMAENQMLQDGDRVLVGLSGGADSVALLCLLDEMGKAGRGFQVFAVHVNHMIRENAGRDEDFSRSLCRQRGIPFYAEKTDVVAVSRREHLSLEDAGRQERYRIFHQYREKLRADRIATAHHMDDAAETILLRLLRGCGTDGLAGILPVREDGVIRPLLCVSRKEVLAYLQSIGQEYVTDESNFSCDYSRNRIRCELLPLLESGYHPGIREGLFRLSRVAQDDRRFLDKAAELKMEQVCGRQDGAVLIDRQKLLAEERAMQSRIIRRAFYLLTEEQLSYSHTEALIQLAGNQSGKGMALPFGTKAEIQYQYLRLSRGEEKNQGFCLPVKDGFEHHFVETGFRVRARLSNVREEGRQLLSVPADRDIVIRSRRQGDMMHLPGTGRKKIKDILIDKKIPRHLRDAWPFVVYGDEIVWMAGYYKNQVDGNHSHYYVITIEKIGEGKQEDE